jgi:uncharacterized protein YyaL (SSP411 family)
MSDEKTENQNKLCFEKSPYLLQHAENPVNWYAWSDEAFAIAAQKDKPIFLSIGYSTCHWCHVMAHESFENRQVAELMNKVFVNIKVDREERPDIDNIYMTVCTMMTGSGGWPLTIIMTPDKKPFFAGTYFPRESRHGRVGMLDLIPSVQEIWTNKREDVSKSAESIITILQKQTSRADSGQELDKTVLHKAFQELSERYDTNHGGFGNAPKFPSPHSLVFLLRYWKQTGNEQSLAMVEKTLTEMRLGGIFDQIGYGFHRYSTDARWLLPHFEKMLYDQALLVNAYLEGYQATGNQKFRKTAEEILTYVLRDMTDHAGGFYSAEDADSEGEEGKFYVWSMAEIRQLITPESLNIISRLFNLDDDGNFHEEATGRKTGTNIFHLNQSLEKYAGELDIPILELNKKIEKIRTLLFTERSKRIPPHKDDKILTDWNGLMIAALSRGARILNKPDFLVAARKAVDFILVHLLDENDTLLHRYRDGEAAIIGMLDDYAFLVWGLLELYDASFETLYLKKAIFYNEMMLERFWDVKNGGLFLSDKKAETLLIRQKEIYDGAIPSGNSVALANLLRLARLTGNQELADKASLLMQSFAEAIIEIPSGYTHFLTGVDLALTPTMETVIVGEPHADSTKKMISALHDTYNPYMVSLFKDSTADADDISEIAPFTEQHAALNNQATAYVCRNFACETPTSDLKQMIRILKT